MDNLPEQQVKYGNFADKNKSVKGQQVVYKISNVTKRYPGTVALSDVNIEFLKGEIHGIIGKNGAGKSTLVNIMYGSEEPTTGKMEIFGEEVSRLSPSKAQSLKIVLIPQKVNYALDLTVAESLFLGNYPRLSLGFINKSELIKKSKELLQKVDLDIMPTTLMRRVSLEDRRLIEIAKALWCFDSKILILDETTTALSIKPKKKLFELLKKVAREESRTVIFITHRLEEIMEICDRISVLRDGSIVTTVIKDTITKEELAKLITGAVLNNKNGNAVKSSDKDDKLSHTGFSASGKRFLKINNLTKRNEFSNINIEADSGEIIGLAGMVGSGANSLLRYLGGLSPENASGSVIINNKKIAPITPQIMIKNGVGYLTNNREEEGLFHNLPITNNMIGSKYRHYTNKLGFLKNSIISGTVKDLQTQLVIKMTHEKDLIDVLSGGNKQKVMVGRLINYNLKIYLFDEVTEGIDIEARRILLDFIKNRISKNSLIITASNVVSDLMEICDRILVMFHGEIIETFEKEDFNEHDIYSALQGLRV